MMPHFRRIVTLLFIFKKCNVRGKKYACSEPQIEQQFFKTISLRQTRLRFIEKFQARKKYVYALFINLPTAAN